MDSNRPIPHLAPVSNPQLLESIIRDLKSQGIFDQFRKDCLADVDTKPSYQNLRQRVEGYVSKFLAQQNWNPTLNKNLLRDSLRRQINDTEMLSLGVEHVVDQIVSLKANRIFLPEIEIAMRRYLGLESLEKNISREMENKSINNIPGSGTKMEQENNVVKSTDSQNEVDLNLPAIKIQNENNAVQDFGGDSSKKDKMFVEPTPVLDTSDSIFEPVEDEDPPPPGVESDEAPSFSTDNNTFEDDLNRNEEEEEGEEEDTRSSSCNTDILVINEFQSSSCEASKDESSTNQSTSKIECEDNKNEQFFKTFTKQQTEMESSLKSKETITTTTLNPNNMNINDLKHDSESIKSKLFEEKSVKFEEKATKIEEKANKIEEKSTKIGEKSVKIENKIKKIDKTSSKIDSSSKSSSKSYDKHKPKSDSNKNAEKSSSSQPKNKSLSSSSSSNKEKDKKQRDKSKLPENSEIKSVHKKHSTSASKSASKNSLKSTTTALKQEIEGKLKANKTSDSFAATSKSSKSSSSSKLSNSKQISIGDKSKSKQNVNKSSEKRKSDSKSSKSIHKITTSSEETSSKRETTTEIIQNVLGGGGKNEMRSQTPSQEKSDFNFETPETPSEKSTSQEKRLFGELESSETDDDFIRSLKRYRRPEELEDDCQKSDVTVSSVHTSDLSSFDDEISLSSSAEENESIEKIPHPPQQTSKGIKETKKVPLKEMKEIAANFLKEKTNSSGRSTPIMPSGDEETNQSKSTVKEESLPIIETQTDDEEHVRTGMRAGLRRQRKINPKYDNDEYTSMFNKSSRKERKSIEENKTEEKNKLKRKISKVQERRNSNKINEEEIAEKQRKISREIISISSEENSD